MSESQSTGSFSYSEVANRLRLPGPILNAALMSGLLGYTPERTVTQDAVEHFERYGVQWRPELGKRLLDATVLGMPMGGVIEPLSTFTQVQISSRPDGLAISEKDEGWMAYFFLRTNDFYFPDPAAIGLTRSVGLKLAGPLAVAEASKPTYLYPDPEGNLATVMVLGQQGSGPAQEGFQPAYDIVTPMLDDLSFRYQQPLPIAHVMMVGIPSGVITLNLPKPQAIATIEDARAKCEHEELLDATAYFREGISTNNPFHQFLALWKSFENASTIRGNWREKNQRRRNDARADTVVIEERFPTVHAFSNFEGLSFGEAKERLRASHRNAVAHGTLEGGRPRTAATAADYMAIATAVPILRYMAHVTLTNVRACLAS